LKVIAIEMQRRVRTADTGSDFNYPNLVDVAALLDHRKSQRPT
jgi:hypothetical protein